MKLRAVFFSLALIFITHASAMVVTQERNASKMVAEGMATNNLELLKLGVAAGGNPHTATVFPVLHYIMCGYLDFSEMLHYLVKETHFNINQKDSGGRTLLYCASTPSTWQPKNSAISQKKIDDANDFIQANRLSNVAALLNLGADIRTLHPAFVINDTLIKMLSDKCIAHNAHFLSLRVRPPLGQTLHGY